MLDKFVTMPEAMPEIDSAERRIIRDHKSYLLNHPLTREVKVDPKYSYPERHNWYRYFMLAGIPMELWYTVLILNDLESTMSLSSEHQTLLMPDVAAVMKIKESIIE